MADLHPSRINPFRETIHQLIIDGNLLSKEAAIYRTFLEHLATLEDVTPGTIDSRNPFEVVINRLLAGRLEHTAPVHVRQTVQALRSFASTKGQHPRHQFDPSVLS